MVTESVKVNPGDNADAIEIALDDVEGIKYPIYKFAVGPDGKAYLIDDDNPVPVGSGKKDTDRKSTLQESIDDLVIQMKILNKYMAEGFDNEIKEEDIL